MDSQKTREYNLSGAQKTDENSSCVKVRKNDGVEIIHERKRACQDVDVKPVVQDPMDDDRVLVESGTEMTPVPREPSEFEKQKHNLTHIPFQPWCTSCVKGKAQAEPHKRTERIIEDSELPVKQCDYLMLKDTAGTGGLKVLSMYVRTFGYGMSTVVETKGPTDSYATTWAVKMLNFLGLSDIILQCDPEPSLIKWAESVKSKRTERTAATSSSSRGEKRTETQENMFVKRWLMVKSPKRPITLVPPPEDPVKRRLLKKTDMRNDELVMNVDENLLNVVSKLTKDENMPEVNSDEDNEMPKFTVLDDYEEMMKGRQKELNSLKEMGTMTVVKRTEAVGKRTIQTRWVDREKVGKVKSRLVLKDYNRCQGRTQPEMFSPTPSTLPLKTMLAASSHDRNNDPESNHITISIDVHTAFLHADVDQDLFAEPPEPDEWYDAGLKEDEVWKLNKALYGYRKAPKLWHKHLVNVLESLNYHPLLTDPSCFRNDETNTNIFVHVDDGLMFGPKSEVLKLVELLSKQVLMRITGRMEKTGDKFYFLGRVIERTARGYSVEANPKYIQNVMNVLGLEEAKPVMTPSVKRTPTTESLVELEGERRAVYRTVVGKLLYMCQQRADVMYSVKETARKITCPTESDEMNLKRIVRYLKGAPSGKSLIEIITPSKFVNVYTDSDWAGQATTCKSTSGGVVQWVNATLTAWSRTQQTVSLSSAEAELYALTTGVAEGMVTKHLLQELGHEVILMNHVDSTCMCKMLWRRS